jgi:molybdopterin molybdotransferase
MTQTREYLTVDEALTAVLRELSVLPAEIVPLLDSLGCILANPIVAQDSLPPFANSAMDGYAVRAADLAGASVDAPVTLQVIGDIAAGTVFTQTITPGTTARIMTGAPMPPGADAIAPVEQSNEAWRDPHRTLASQVEIYHAPAPGDYVRPAGEDIQAGSYLLSAGHLLRPQEIGILAALGVAHVPVVRRPRVAVLSTGDELLPIDQPLQPGKIRNSNSYAQAAQLLAMGAAPTLLGIARDTEEDVRARLQEGLDAGVDLFISSAGVSVGAYDVVKTVLAEGGEIGFWRVRMRPGKPLAFGHYRGVPYLGLPGNPVSAMVSFERFARPAVRKMAGHTLWTRPEVRAIVQEDIESDGRESYIRALVSREGQGYIAHLAGAQGSNIISSLVKANALLIVPEGVRRVAAGAALSAVMIDWPETVF